MTKQHSRFRFAVLGIAFLLVSLPVLGGVSSEINNVAAEKSRASATFTNASPIAFGSTGANVGSLYPSPITVSGLAGDIPVNDPNAVKVTLNNVSHTYLADLGIVLTSPAGRSLLLQLCASDSDGFASNNLTYSISDAGPTQLSDAQNPVEGGVYRPATYCSTSGGGFVPFPGATYMSPGPDPAGSATFSSTFGGTSPNGTWRLSAVDFFNGDGGAIAGGWTLEINTDEPRTISIADLEQAEGNFSTTQFMFSVTLSGGPVPSGQSFSVDFATEDGTALAGSDYQSVSGALAFTAGTGNTRQIAVTVSSDTMAETDEFFTVILSNPTGGASLVRTVATGWIISDDPIEPPLLFEGDVVDAQGGPGGDGMVLANDLTALRQFVLGNSFPVPGTAQFQRADVNLVNGIPCGNGFIDAGDVTVVRQMILGSITNSSPACGSFGPNP